MTAPRRSAAELRAIHARNTAAGRPAAAPLPPPRAHAAQDERERAAAGSPEIVDSVPYGDELEHMNDALVLVASSVATGDVGSQAAATKLAEKRGIQLQQAMRIVRAAKVHLTGVGKVRKELDKDNAAYLIGETRHRLMMMWQFSMAPDNFRKGGAAVAFKCAAAVAVLDGCPIDGMIQVAQYKGGDGDEKPVDPERQRIAIQIMTRAGLAPPLPRQDGILESLGEA